MGLTRGVTGKSVNRPADYEEPYYWATGVGFYGGKYPAWWGCLRKRGGKAS